MQRVIRAFGASRHKRTLLGCVILSGLIALAQANAQPILLIFADPAPPIQQNEQPYDPNVDLKPHLTPFLDELRKVQVEWYSPTHPTARQFAQRRDLRDEQLAHPSPVLRGQLARAWGATYVMTVRCTRPPDKAQYEYAITVWELGRRAPVWESEGFQQLATGAGRADADAALQTLGRTIAMRLDGELWASLPRVAEQVRTPTLTPAPPREEPTPVDEPQRVEQLLREGKLHEALLPMRTLVNAEPENTERRLQLIQLYRRLNLPDAARDELQRAMQLFPDHAAILQAWVELLLASGDYADAVARLQKALEQQPQSRPIRLALADALLMLGDADAAARALQPLATHDDPETAFRRYLLSGATNTPEDSPATPLALRDAHAHLWLQMATRMLADFASELLDLRRLALSPNPNRNELRQRSERAVLTGLRIGQWLERVQPEDASRRTVAHARFAGQMLAQAAQHMARFVLSRNPEEEERASLLRVEAMRELEQAKNALPKREP
ncbi:MAG: tetratricopeptide repeat protein [Fimbriimonadales bacterium]